MTFLIRIFLFILIISLLNLGNNFQLIVEYIPQTSTVYQGDPAILVRLAEAVGYTDSISADG